MADYVFPPAVTAIPTADGGLFPVRRVYCVGRNYAEHAREMGHEPNEAPPFFFGKPADALAKADQRLTANPRDPQLRFLRGVAQADSGKQTEAVATFTKLTEDYPELPEPYNNLAALYAQQSKFDLARDALENAIRLNPNYATAHENLGDVYTRLAAQSYAKAQQLASTNASAAPKLALIRQIFTGTPATVSALPAAPTDARKQTRTTTK